MSQEKMISFREAGDPLTSLSEGDRGLRRAAAEEQAANLRDDKLLAATGTTTNVHDSTKSGGAGKRGGTGSSSPLLVSSLSAAPNFPAGSPKAGESYSDQRDNSENFTALTEANMEKFNANKLDDARIAAQIPWRPSVSTAVDGAGLTRSPSVESTNAIGGDIPADARMDSLHDPSTTEIAKRDDSMYDSLAAAPQQPRQPSGTGTATPNTVARSLSAQGRGASNWSQNTVKP